MKMRYLAFILFLSSAVQAQDRNISVELFGGPAHISGYLPKKFDTEVIHYPRLSGNIAGATIDIPFSRHFSIALHGTTGSFSGRGTIETHGEYATLFDNGVQNVSLSGATAVRQLSGGAGIGTEFSKGRFAFGGHLIAQYSRIETRVHTRIKGTALVGVPDDDGVLTMMAFPFSDDSFDKDVQRRVTGAVDAYVRVRIHGPMHLEVRSIQSALVSAPVTVGITIDRPLDTIRSLFRHH